MGPFSLRIDLGDIAGKLASPFQRRRYKLKIKDPHLARPMLLFNHNPNNSISDGPTTDFDSTDPILPFKFDIEFTIASKKPQYADGCEYAVVVEHPSSNPGARKTTENFYGELGEFNGLTEPQIAPVELRTDFDQHVRFSSVDGNIDTYASLNDPIDVKLKVNSRTIPADSKTVALHRLLADWAERCRGIDMKAFADLDRLEGDEQDLPQMTIGEDITAPELR